MKHYLDKLNNKPRLKKCLKVLAIVGICLSVIFNGVIIGSVIAQRVNNSNNDKSIQNLATTPIRHDSIHQGVFYAYSMTDISNENGLNSMLSYLRANNNPNAWSLTDTGTTNDQILASYESQVFSASLYTFTARDNLGNNVNLGDIDYIGVWEHYYPTGDYHLKFDMALRKNNQDLIYMRWFVYDNVDTLDIHNGLLIFSEYWYNPYGTQTTNRNADVYLTTYTADPLGLMFGEVNNLWQQGYETGRQRGYEEGYAQGEISGELSQNSNVFGMIANAFGAVASVLNIEILPHLTLGLLLFVPVIVSVLIVVVKMIKG